jgi:NAD(P)-dependent dehydrogenase (short-subunit alcohol dehydrogenase family)
MPKTILVTGAANGLGRVMAEAALAKGHQVLAMDLPGEEAALASLAAAHPGAVATQHGDITNLAQCEAAVAACLSRFGRLDVLLNNAGLGMGSIYGENPPPPFWQIPEASWTRLVDVNLNGTFRMTRSAIPAMIEQGGGGIITVTTSYFTMLNPGFSPYGPSKVALEASTVMWAAELAPHHITANVLVPGGATNTRFVPQRTAPDRSKLIQPEVMVAPLQWLLSESAAGVTAQRIVGRDWNPALPVAEALATAMRPAGFIPTISGPR